MCCIVAKWVPYYLNKVQQWICHETCPLILEMTSSTFTPQTRSLKKSVTYEADDNYGIWHLRCSWRLILFNRVRLWMCGITSHLCSYGEVSRNGWKCYLTWCCYSALGRHCQELSWSWGWEVLQHPPVLLTSVHNSLIWFWDYMGHNIQTGRTF